METKNMNQRKITPIVVTRIKQKVMKGGNK